MWQIRSKGSRSLPTSSSSGSSSRPSAGQLGDDGLLALGRLPARRNSSRLAYCARMVLREIVAQRLGDELAVAVQVLDALGQHGDRPCRGCRTWAGVAAAVAAGSRRRRVDQDSSSDRRLRLSASVPSPASAGGSGGTRRVMFAGFVDLHRLAVEVRVGKVRRGAAKVDQREVVLLRVLVHARAAADDLLELGHRADRCGPARSAGRSAHRRRWTAAARW